ncbi:TPA: toll/interleukin-1 receptor domain-containing protein [Enterococcus faecalis]|uniref:toll/interleukin-1 receptor domain-containing protein n=1 Tax=Enterococcus faecalis TaxID=1351 RepID=UPI0024313F21|nr:toll/interleukin-1 receptor domain-containing protein [Enterococcus faecalis]HAP3021350.1 toll/interleukin-1 receptor domain-containing protein [Enterococcus faecalis]
MEGIFRIYDREFLDQLLSKMSVNYKKKRFLIPIEEIGIVKDSIDFYFLKKQIEEFYKNRFSKTVIVQWNKRKNLLEIGEFGMKKKITFRFPYEDYDCYYEVIKEINDLIDINGVCGIFANNIYYSVESGIVIETNSNFEEIKQIAEKAGMKPDYSFGLHELALLSLKNNQYNCVMLRTDHDLNGIKKAMKDIFFFPSKTEMKKENFRVQSITKKKFFVSYSHKNKLLVRNIINELRDYGLDFWVDEEQIDVGDRLMERINEGVQTADIPIIFLSEATKESAFAKHELLSFFSKIIYQQSSKKPWFIIKLDQVDPNEIVLGLGDFKYIDYEHSTIEEIAQAIEKKMN